MIKYIFLIISITFIIYLFYFSIETFTNMAGYYADTNKCQKYNFGPCLKTANCGWSISSNPSVSPQCVPGDMYGPYNSNDSDQYYYNNNWYRALLMNDNNPSEYKV